LKAAKISAKRTKPRITEMNITYLYNEAKHGPNPDLKFS